MDPDHTSSTTQLLPLSVCQPLFVCVEVLPPSQPNGVVSSAVNLPNHTFTGQAFEIFSAVILSLLLIQEGQLSVSAKECAQYWLTA